MPEITSSGFIWLPSTTQPIYRITVEENGIEINLTSQAIFIEIEDGINELIGRFSFELWNFNNQYTDRFNGMEIVRFYADRGSSATTLRFRGRIEKLSYQRNKIRTTGRSEALNFMNQTVTQSFTNQECSSILKSLINTYRPDTSFTTTNINASTTNLTINWRQKPFWDVLQDLTTASGFDAYLDSSKDFHFFRKGSIDNDNEAIIHNQNLIEVRDFADDINLVKNRIIVYGAEIDGIQILYTAENASSQNLFGLREEIISDSNITDFQQAKELAEFKLSSEPSQVGEVKGVFIPTIQPGEKIRISSPMDTIQPALYNIVSYKHEVGDGRFFTTVRMTKEPRGIVHVMKKMIEDTSKQKETSSNPFEMRFSFNSFFDSDIGTHSGTEITNGVLKPIGATGNWISQVENIS